MKEYRIRKFSDDCIGITIVEVEYVLKMDEWQELRRAVSEPLPPPPCKSLVGCPYHGPQAIHCSEKTRLIAAAPDMYDCLVAVLDDWQKHGSIFVETIEEVQSAISKVEGAADQSVKPNEPDTPTDYTLNKDLIKCLNEFIGVQRWRYGNYEKEIYEILCLIERVEKLEPDNDK